MAKIKLHIIEDDHYLYINGHMWMWNLKEEKRMQKKIADQAFGKVLVVGYGLGIVHSFLENNPAVEKLVTVEKYPRVIEINQEVYGKILGEIIIADFNKYQPNQKFDCIIGDIWEDIDSIYLPKYRRFKNHAQQFLNPNGQLLAWGQDYFEYLLSLKQLPNR